MTASCPSVRQAAGDDDDGTGAQRAGLVRRRMEVFDQAQPLSAVHAAAIDSTQRRRRRRRSSIPKEQIYMLFSCCRRATSNTVVSRSRHTNTLCLRVSIRSCQHVLQHVPASPRSIYQLTVTSVCSRRVVERDAANTKQT